MSFFCGSVNSVIRISHSFRGAKTISYPSFGIFLRNRVDVEDHVAVETKKTWDRET